MFKRMLWGALFLVSFTGSAVAQDVRVEFEGRYWFPDLDAKAQAVESNVGTEFDMKSDLGIKNENFPEGRFIWHTGPHSQIRFSYTQAKYEGDQTVPRTVNFEGQTYTGGTRVISDFNLLYFEAGWIWQFIHFWDDKVKLGTLIEGSGVFTDITLEAPNLAPPVKESQQYIAGLPTGGLALTIEPYEWVGLFAEASGFPAGSYGYFFDGEGGVKFTPIRNLTLKGGYRIITLKADSDPDFIKVDLSGFFVGGSLRF